MRPVAVRFSRAFSGSAASRALALSASLAFASRASAHHGMDGDMPETFAEGLISGLAHPVIGLDHLLAVVALGLAAAVLPAGLVLPATFVFATVLGTVLHLFGLGLPATELVIALSVSGFGALLVLAHALEQSKGYGLLGVAMLLAGTAHGYAYGETIVGAQPGPLSAYLVGFIGVQLLVAALVRTGARAFLRARPEAERRLALRFAGAAFVIAGSAYAVSAAVA